MRLQHLTVDAARAILAAHAWKTPSHYAGFSPTGDYCILTQHRDSDALTRSNWACARNEFDVQPFDCAGRFGASDEEFDARPDAYDWRASHCLVGWVEYLMVRTDAPDDVLITAAQLLDALDGYPVLDDEHFSNLEMEEAEESWKHLDLRGRLEVIDDCRYDGKPISIFAIRHDYPPVDDQGAVQERLR
jgi:hypothetical protein